MAGPRIGDSPVMRRSSPNNFHFVRWDFPESSRSLARSLGGQKPLRAAAWLLVSQLRDATCKTCWSEFLVFRNLTFFLARAPNLSDVWTLQFFLGKAGGRTESQAKSR